MLASQSSLNTFDGVEDYTTHELVNNAIRIQLWVSEDELLWELRGPIAAHVPPSQPDEAGVGVKHLEGMQVAFAMHRGPYESIEGTYYESLMTWIVDNGYEISGPAEEVYFSPPETPAEDVLTEVRFPVKQRQA